MPASCSGARRKNPVPQRDEEIADHLQLICCQSKCRSRIRGCSSASPTSGLCSVSYAAPIWAEVSTLRSNTLISVLVQPCCILSHSQPIRRGFSWNMLVTHSNTLLDADALRVESCKWLDEGCDLASMMASHVNPSAIQRAAYRLRLLLFLSCLVSRESTVSRVIVSMESPLSESSSSPQVSPSMNSSLKSSAQGSSPQPTSGLSHSKQIGQGHIGAAA